MRVSETGNGIAVDSKKEAEAEAGPPSKCLESRQHKAVGSSI